jgi:hypothetical protein
MQFERVGPVAVARLLLEVLGQVDDHDGLERALLDADTAPDTQLLRQKRNLVGGAHLDTQLACTVDHGGVVSERGCGGAQQVLPCALRPQRLWKSTLTLSQPWPFPNQL